MKLKSEHLIFIMSLLTKVAKESVKLKISKFWSDFTLYHKPTKKKHSYVLEEDCHYARVGNLVWTSRTKDNMKEIAQIIYAESLPRPLHS
jgi:hypothetical protein